MLADELDYVVGVDTHRDEHVLAVVAAATGAVLARQAVRANARGYKAALRFAGEAALGARAWAPEWWLHETYKDFLSLDFVDTAASGEAMGPTPFGQLSSRGRSFLQQLEAEEPDAA